MAAGIVGVPVPSQATVQPSSAAAAAAAAAAAGERASEAQRQPLAQQVIQQQAAQRPVVQRSSSPPTPFHPAAQRPGARQTAVVPKLLPRGQLLANLRLREFWPSSGQGGASVRYFEELRPRPTAVCHPQRERGANQQLQAVFQQVPRVHLPGSLLRQEVE